MKRIAASAVLQGVFTFMPQVVGLLAFTAIEFGHLAGVLLIYAWLVSILYSVVNETWARSRQQTDDGRQFAGALIRYCLVVAAVAGGVLTAVPTMRQMAASAAVATFVALMRDGSRYWQLATGHATRVVASDVAGLLGYAVWMVVSSQAGPLSVSAVLHAWTFGAAVAAVGLLPSWAGAWRGSLWRWCLDRQQVIRPLLGESLLMDTGALGGPLLIGMATSTAQFGGYRAVQSLAGPLNVLFTALRPVVVGVSSLSARARLVNLSLVAGMMTALLAPAAILMVARLAPGGSVLEGLGAVALPAGLMLAGRIAAVPSYLLVRLHASGRMLIGARVVDLACVLALPLLGLLVGGFTGAVVGLAAGNVVSAAVWQWSARHLPAPAVPILPSQAKKTSC